MAARIETSVVNHVQELAIHGYEPPSRFIHKDGPTNDALGSSILPIVDLHLLLSESAPTEEKQQETEKLKSALSSWGFFQAIGHGISDSLLDDVRNVAKEFFHLPKEQKERYAVNPNAKGHDVLQGYGNELKTSKELSLDWCDRLYLLVKPEQQRNLNFWPENPRQFREILDEYSTKTSLLPSNIVEAMAKVVGLEKDAFLSQFGEEATMHTRFNYYPQCSKPNHIYGLKPHTDGGGITIVLQDKEVEGLQVLKDGEWIKVPVIPNALVVNIADQMQIMSNGMFKSSLHRVIPNSDKERISVAAFYSPHYDNVIGPADGLIDENRPRLFTNIKVIDYFKLFIEKYLEGKKGIDSVKI